MAEHGRPGAFGRMGKIFRLLSRGDPGNENTIRSPAVPLAPFPPSSSPSHPSSLITRASLWALYHQAGLFNARRSDAISHAPEEAEKTWERLLAADESVLWHDYERVDGELRSSCMAFRHTATTRVMQHWVSHRNPEGTRNVLLSLLRRFTRDPSTRLLRCHYRPENPLAIRLFRSLHELAPSESVSLNLCEVLRVSTAKAEGNEPERPSTETLSRFFETLKKKFGALELKSEGLDGDDPLAEGVAALYGRAGLNRERAIIPVCRPAWSKRGPEPPAWEGLAVADASSFGLSLSGFNNSVRFLVTAESPRPESIENAVGALKRFYARRGLSEFLVFIEPSHARALLGEGGRPDIARQDLCYSGIFDLGGGFGEIMMRHVKSFYEARLGLARIVADLDEDELDWVNERGERVAFQPGETLLRQGETAESFFILQAGEVGVFQGSGSARRQLAVCRAPDAIGEIGVLQGVRRTATVVALTPVIALSISKTKLEEFIRVFPEGGQELKTALNSRLEHDELMETLAGSGQADERSLS